jgi:short subunit fatty acids transporter
MDFTANGVNQAEIYDGGGGAGYLQINSNSQYNWSGGVPGVTVADTGMARVTAGVVGATNGTTGAGWFRNTAGELALNADYTNATATYSNTALSATVISGRTYSFDLSLMLTESTAADGVKIDFNGGSAAATNFRVGCVLTNDVGTIVTQTSAVSTTLAGVISATATVTTAQHRYSCSGSFVPSGAGTFIVRAGQVAHTTGTLTVHRGSWLNIRDANSL